jgi:hypothetical protein
MDNIGITILISFVSGIAGYLLSVWRNRLQPWISVLDFAESRKLSDPVNVNKKIVDATKESWFMDTIPQHETDMDYLYRAVSAAKNWLYLNKNTQDILRDGIKQLESANTQNEIIESLQVLLSDNISALIEISVLRKLIVPEHKSKDKQILSFYLDKQKEDGCYAIAFLESYFMFGSNLNNNEHKAAELLSFINLLTRLDKENLIKLFKQVEPIYKKQHEIHTAIQAEAENIVKENSRWTSRISISNFGATPFLIFPDEAKLIVQGKQIKQFELECRILVQNYDDSSPGWEEAEGVIILKPAYTEVYSIVTKKTQKELDGGTLLRQVFENGGAEAYVEIKVLGRELPWKQKVKSTTLVFAEN